MGLASGIKQLISPEPGLTQEQLRKMRPIHHPDVTATPQADGSLVLTAPLMLQGRGFMGWMARRMKMPDRKSFELEPIGAFVWELCDGKHTFDAISRKLRDRYKMNRLEADAALTAFLQMLGQRRLITLKSGKP